MNENVKAGLKYLVIFAVVAGTIILLALFGINELKGVVKGSGELLKALVDTGLDAVLDVGKTTKFLKCEKKPNKCSYVGRCVPCDSVVLTEDQIANEELLISVTPDCSDVIDKDKNFVKVDLCKSVSDATKFVPCLTGETPEKTGFSKCILKDYKSAGSKCIDCRQGMAPDCATEQKCSAGPATIALAALGSLALLFLVVRKRLAKQFNKSPTMTDLDNRIKKLENQKKDLDPIKNKNLIKKIDKKLDKLTAKKGDLSVKQAGEARSITNVTIINQQNNAFMELKNSGPSKSHNFNKQLLQIEGTPEGVIDRKLMPQELTKTLEKNNSKFSTADYSSADTVRQRSVVALEIEQKLKNKTAFQSVKGAITTKLKKAVGVSPETRAKVPVHK